MRAHTATNSAIRKCREGLASLSYQRGGTADKLDDSGGIGAVQFVTTSGREFVSPCSKAPCSGPNFRQFPSIDASVHGNQILGELR